MKIHPSSMWIFMFYKMKPTLYTANQQERPIVYAEGGTGVRWD